jgi:signal transduction histidine kinase
MPVRDWLGRPRSMLTLFLCLMSVCAGALTWLGWKVIEQDSAVEAQRVQERLEGSADRIVAALDRSLQRIGDFADARKPDPEEIFVVVSGGSVEVNPRGGLAFSPCETGDSTQGPDVFSEAESLEFGRRNPEEALDTYRRLARSKSLQVRAGALVRMGRALRRQQRWRDALKTYDELEKTGSFSVAGMPASLVASAARCSVLEESGQRQELQREAQTLWEDLTGGRWTLTRPTLDTYADEVRRWIGTLPSPPNWDERFALAKAAATEWQAWQADEESAASGRQFHLVDGVPVSVSWSSRDGAWHARIAGPSFWRRLWAGLGQNSGVTLSLTNEHGDMYFGVLPAEGPTVHRPSPATRLPWNLTVAPVGDWTRSAAFEDRRRLIAAGLFIFALLLAAGSYFIARAMLRELAVAQLQSDFVAAVSHEFRTPLASIRQLTEMIARRRIDTEEQTLRACELMMAESDRLGRLVESLLDFGRMQSGAYRVQFQSLDAKEWARAVVERFGEAVRSKGYAIEFDSSVDGERVQADSEALAGALWNLLDNAVKYSPDHKKVQVEVAAGEGTVEFRVRDRGSGIAGDDCKQVFEKFYRGGNAKETGAKGAGIGLTLVREIARAHGGEVRLESTPGEGSVFTLSLPVEEAS